MSESAREAPPGRRQQQPEQAHHGDGDADERARRVRQTLLAGRRVRRKHLHVAARDQNSLLHSDKRPDVAARSGIRSRRSRQWHQRPEHGEHERDS